MEGTKKTDTVVCRRDLGEWETVLTSRGGVGGQRRMPVALVDSSSCLGLTLDHQRKRVGTGERGVLRDRGVAVAWQGLAGRNC